MHLVGGRRLHRAERDHGSSSGSSSGDSSAPEDPLRERVVVGVSRTEERVARQPLDAVDVPQLAPHAVGGENAPEPGCWRKGSGLRCPGGEVRKDLRVQRSVNDHHEYTSHHTVNGHSAEPVIAVQ